MATTKKKTTKKTAPFKVTEGGKPNYTRRKPPETAVVLRMEAVVPRSMIRDEDFLNSLEGFDQDVNSIGGDVRLVEAFHTAETVEAAVRILRMRGVVLTNRLLEMLESGDG